jgi:hypothetical protein
MNMFNKLIPSKAYENGTWSAGFITWRKVDVIKFKVVHFWNLPLKTDDGFKELLLLSSVVTFLSQDIQKCS